MLSLRYQLTTLIVVVAISGVSQGLTLPLLAILLEEQGVSSVDNGLNAAATYLGILLVSPWLELPLRRLGYRSMIFAGLCLVTVATLLLPLTSGLAIWFVLRMLIGIGDYALHYASQIWLTAISPLERRGRNIALYGLSYGVGFSIGPLGIHLLPLGRWAPFLAVTLIFLLGFLLLARMENAYPEQVAREGGKRENRYRAVIRLSWLALLPPFIYGYVEATLNGSFPVYALRTGISKEWVAVILPSFVIGSLLLQMPLGSLGDRIGRKKVILGCALIGAVSFSLLPAAGSSVWLILVLLGVAGAAVGSFYSFGLAFAADILPKEMVPTAGIIIGVNFSLASFIAPNLNGYLIQFVSPAMIFWLIGGMFALVSVSGLFFRTDKSDALNGQTAKTC